MYGSRLIGFSTVPSSKRQAFPLTGHQRQGRCTEISITYNRHLAGVVVEEQGFLSNGLDVIQRFEEADKTPEWVQSRCESA